MHSLITAVCCVLLLAGCTTVSNAVNVSRSNQTSHSSGSTGAAVAPYTAGNKTPYEVFGEVYEVMPDSYGYLEIGVASWYGKKFNGKLTSNGEIYDMYKPSAAHKTLPIPSMVKVTNLDNGKSIVLRVNDRGPFHDDRVIDLSYYAAKQLGFANQGTAPVVVEAVNELNHPERVKQTHDKPESSYYLQVGAFSELKWAEHLQDRIRRLMEENAASIDVRILPTELEESILHKVWLGPIRNEEKREQIARLVEAANLGSPLRVEVE